MANSVRLTLDCHAVRASRLVMMVRRIVGTRHATSLHVSRHCEARSNPEYHLIIQITKTCTERGRSIKV